jgi:hypothetical protein
VGAAPRPYLDQLLATIADKATPLRQVTALRRIVTRQMTQQGPVRDGGPRAAPLRA